MSDLEVAATPRQFRTGATQGVSLMAPGLHAGAVECRLLLCKSGVSFAERKTTILKSSDIGCQPTVWSRLNLNRSPKLPLEFTNR